MTGRRSVSLDWRMALCYEMSARAENGILREATWREATWREASDAARH